MPVHFEDDRVRIHKVVASPYDNNAYVIVCRATGESVVVDAPREVDKVIAETQGTKVKSVLITHSHFDHIEGFEAMRAKLDRPPTPSTRTTRPACPHRPTTTWRRATSSPWATSPSRCSSPPATRRAASACSCRGISSPATRCSPAGPARPGAPTEFRQVVESITGRLLSLPADTAVYPGHGADTTIGRSGEEYAAFAARPHPPDLHGDVLWLTS